MKKGNDIQTSYSKGSGVDGRVAERIETERSQQVIPCAPYMRLTESDKSRVYLYPGSVLALFLTVSRNAQFLNYRYPYMGIELAKKKDVRLYNLPSVPDLQPNNLKPETWNLLCA